MLKKKLKLYTTEELHQKLYGYTEDHFKMFDRLSDRHDIKCQIEDQDLKYALDIDDGDWWYCVTIDADEEERGRKDEEDE